MVIRNWALIKLSPFSKKYNEEDRGFLDKDSRVASSKSSTELAIRSQIKNEIER